MVSKTFLIALLFVTSLNPTNLLGQDSGCTRRAVPVGVVDREWNVVQGLSAANFRGKLGGHEVEILSASVDTSPRRMVLLIDASGSMMVPDVVWGSVKSLWQHLIRFPPPRASIAQMAFSASILSSAGFDQDRLALLIGQAAVLRACEQSQGNRSTALYDAIWSARGTLGVPNSGDVIYAVTDAGDNASQSEPKKVEEGLQAAGIRLFAVVVVPYDRFRGRVPVDSGFDRLHSMVEASGGNLLEFPYHGASRPYSSIKAKTRADAVDLALQRLYQQMGEFYRLRLKLPETLDKATKWKLEVIEANGRPDRRVEIHYPQQLMPCAQQSE
jgi:hypothetical protein